MQAILLVHVRCKLRQIAPALPSRCRRGEPSVPQSTDEAAMETIGTVENNEARFPQCQQLPQPLLLFFRLRQILKPQNLVTRKTLLRKKTMRINNLLLNTGRIIGRGLLARALQPPPEGTE